MVENGACLAVFNRLIFRKGIYQQAINILKYRLFVFLVILKVWLLGFIVPLLAPTQVYGQRSNNIDGVITWHFVSQDSLTIGKSNFTINADTVAELGRNIFGYKITVGNKSAFGLHGLSHIYTTPPIYDTVFKSSIGILALSGPDVIFLGKSNQPNAVINAQCFKPIGGTRYILNTCAKTLYYATSAEVTKIASNIISCQKTTDGIKVMLDKNVLLYDFQAMRIANIPGFDSVNIGNTETPIKNGKAFLAFRSDTTFVGRIGLTQSSKWHNNNKLTLITDSTFLITTDSTFALADIFGSYIIPPACDTLLNLGNGLLFQPNGINRQAIASNGCTYYQNEVDYVSALSTGIALTRVAEDISTLGPAGNIILKATARFDWAWVAGHDSLLITQKQKQYGVADKNSITRLSNRYDTIYQLCNGKAVVNLGGKVIAVNLKDEIIVQPGQNQILILPDGQLIIKTQKGYHFYVSSEIENITQHYQEITFLAKGYYLLKKNYKFGIAITNGVAIIPTIYTQIIPTQSFQCFIVRLANNYGLLNASGGFLLYPNYSTLKYLPLSGYYMFHY